MSTRRRRSRSGLRCIRERSFTTKVMEPLDSKVKGVVVAGNIEAIQRRDVSEFSSVLLRRNQCSSIKGAIRKRSRKGD